MNDAILQGIAECYGTHASQLKPLPGGHWSHVYEFSEAPQGYVLRIAPPNDEIDVQAMEAILEWMRFLSVHGASVPSPVLSRHHRWIECLEQEGDRYVAVVFEKWKGILGEELPVARWDEKLCESLGQAVGKMHALAKHYVPPNDSLRRPEWDRIGNCFSPVPRLDARQAVVREKKEAVWSHVHTLPQDRDCYGLIHADLHFGNLLVDVQGPTITVLDFDDCCYGWYVMDTAMSLFDILVLYRGSAREESATRFMQSYLRGYLRENDVSAFWIGQLPHFLKLLEIGVYTQLYRDYDPDDANPWVSTFMPERKYRIENDIPYVNIDFVNLLEAV